MYCQLDQIIQPSSNRLADKIAVQDNQQALTYQQLDEQVEKLSQAFLRHSLAVGSRIAIYLPKQVEALVAKFAASRAGLVFVPINPLLKPAQVAYILKDCNVELLITSSQRANICQQALVQSPDLKQLLLVDNKPIDSQISATNWLSFIESKAANKPITAPISIDQNLAAILYTSGSTGQPKGVCLSHRNLIAGAQSVSHYLHNNSEDKILAVLPFSFDYGLSQATTALLSGATLILMEYLLPRDVIRQVAKHHITGLAAVPPLWLQLSNLEWPLEAQQSLRYITNSGGAMPQATLQQLRQALPNTQVYLMYGLTEAFRSTYLEPEQLDRRPDSIGKAIPNAEILILREDGSECEADEIGELVHRGVHVSLGYWNSPEKTAIRFKPYPRKGLSLTEASVWSGDQVKKDSEGFIYFVGRNDDMIKCSGYRISPSELEDALYQHPQVDEVAALGVEDQQTGQAVLLFIHSKHNSTQTDDADLEHAIRQYCKKELPNFMQPKYIHFSSKLPRNPNGKIDRKLLLKQFMAESKAEG